MVLQLEGLNKHNQILFMRFILFVFIVSASQALAQQNLFNIPSGDITARNKTFYQHQINVYPNKLESKGHFVYGLGKGWDIGANIVGKEFNFYPDWEFNYNDNPQLGALFPYLMFTAQKQFNLSEKFDLNFGTQTGFNLSRKISNKELAFFNYMLGVYYFMGKKSRVVGGLYHTNDFFVGEGNNAGVMLGYEVKLSKRFYLMGDWISGNNIHSVAVIGGMYNASRRIQLCSGLLIPNPENPNPLGIVLEINILGWDLDLD
ncbi:hypothetical protein SAMN04488541_1001150 [Thermoflexibacter ruber]|uniref:Uncharacterized protein n=1 Tax=Thermoflexibacter ruber TaxID=1003 RepID=A0A1I2AI72_9BACT|nr:hypothetical protein SAMN04488541_1001150 [Thermoflexibacter ruber]